MLPGCVAYQQIDLNPTSIINARLNVGDSVSVKTYSDLEYSFTITKVDDKNLYGEDRVIAISDIRSLVNFGKPYKVGPLIIGILLLIWLNHDLGSDWVSVE